MSDSVCVCVVHTYVERVRVKRVLSLSTACL